GSALRAPPSATALLPVVGAVTDRCRLTGLGPLGGGDELADLHRVLVPGARLHAGDDVDTPRVDAGDGLADVVAAQPTRHQQAHAVGNAIGQAPVEHFARARRRRVQQDGV